MIQKLRLASIGLVTAFILPPSLGAQTAVVFRFEAANWDNLGAERERNDATGLEAIVIDNRSDEAIVIQTIKLVECQNLRTTCGVHKVKSRVGPKERKVVLRVYARDRTRWFTFGYTYTWLPENHDAFLARQNKVSLAASRDTTRFSPAAWDNLIMTTHLDEMGDGQILSLENRSDETVAVTSITLSDCMNLSTKCERYPMDVVLAPKEKKNLLTVRRTGNGLASSFRRAFEWHRVPDQE